MTWPKTWRVATRSIGRAPFRSTLMGSGLVLGVLAMTLTAASGEGARREVERGWKAMVGNLDALLVMAGGRAQRGMATMATAITTLTVDDALAIAQQVPNVRAVAMQQSQFGAGIEAEGRNATTALLGVTANAAELSGDSVAQGMFFTTEHDEAMARVVVLGADVTEEFFPGLDPIGRQVTVANVALEVVGVLAPNGAGPGGTSMDNRVYVPLRTTARRIFNRDHLSMLRVQLVRPRESEETVAAVAALLRERHSIQLGELDDFHIISPRAVIAQTAAVDSTLRRAILWLGLVALGIGGVVIANLMYAATADRRREIGTRRSFGAMRRDILRQFWTEAVMVALAAGALGVVLSFAVVGIGAALLGYQLVISWSVTLVALAAAIAVGLLAGFFPARRAAMLAPAATLREEG